MVQYDLVSTNTIMSPFNISIHETTQISKKSCFLTEQVKESQCFVFTYGDQVHKGFCHHISIKLLLTRIQESPLSWTEVHNHILKGHWLLKKKTKLVSVNCQFDKIWHLDRTRSSHHSESWKTRLLTEMQIGSHLVTFSRKIWTPSGTEIEVIFSFTTYLDSHRWPRV